MRLACNKPVVNINLKNGVYVLDNESSTGKTYLLGILKTLSVGEPVIGFTYSDYKSGNILEASIRGRELIMFDRYDRYKNNYIDIINEMRDSAIILLDCKNKTNLRLKTEPCYMTLTDNSIEVEE